MIKDLAVGVIYVLTNASLKDNIVKIGYSDNLEQRINTLNVATGLPLPFEWYCYLPVTKRLLDKDVHKLIDTINPNLRVKTNEREREFFKMTPQQACNILSILANLLDSGYCVVSKENYDQLIDNHNALDDKACKLMEIYENADSKTRNATYHELYDCYSKLVFDSSNYYDLDKKYLAANIFYFAILVLDNKCDMQENFVKLITYSMNNCNDYARAYYNYVLERYDYEFNGYQPLERPIIDKYNSLLWVSRATKLREWCLNRSIYEFCKV